MQPTTCVDNRDTAVLRKKTCRHTGLT